MKKSFLFILLGLSVVLFTISSGCHKEVFYGNVMFWFDANNGTGTVNIAGQQATITGFVTGGVPQCENAVSATFRLPEGSYGYTASATNGFTWNGTAIVYANQCQAYELQ